VLGITQPSYPSPLPSSVPPPPNTLPLAIPQVPVRVTVGGQELPICAVYMSINESLKSVTQAINELNPLLPPVPPNVLNDLFFPDLRAQPWYTAPGSSFSVAMAKALADNGFWESGGVLQWKNKGQGFLVNENSSNQPTDSNDSAYFLWDEVGGVNNVKGKATVVWYNTQATPNPSIPNDWKNRNNVDLNPDKRYWFWVLDAPGDANDVPGPVPLLGAAAAFRCSRQLRRRLAAAR